MNAETFPQSIAGMSPEQLPIPKHKLHGWRHFVGLYAGEHVAATEFVIGATFVALGATYQGHSDRAADRKHPGHPELDAHHGADRGPDATEPLYLPAKMAGDSMTNLYNWANVVIFTVISAAMITVSCSAVRMLFGIPAQLNWYPPTPCLCWSCWPSG